MDASSFQQGINIDFTFEVLKDCDKQSMSFRKIKRIISKILGFVDICASTLYYHSVNFPRRHTKLYKIRENHSSHT